MSEIHSRINALRDSKRDMAIRMMAPNIHQLAIDAICHEMEGIEVEIASNMEELNQLLVATPIRNNHSPT